MKPCLERKENTASDCVLWESASRWEQGSAFLQIFLTPESFRILFLSTTENKEGIRSLSPPEKLFFFFLKTTSEPDKECASSVIKLSDLSSGK